MAYIIGKDKLQSEHEVVCDLCEDVVSIGCIVATLETYAGTQHKCMLCEENGGNW